MVVNKERTRVLSVRVTERMADEIQGLATATHMSQNGVVMMLLAHALRSSELTAFTRVGATRAQ